MSSSERSLFRLKNPSTPFAQEVYLLHRANEWPVHPHGFSSKSIIRLGHFPTAPEWKSIFYMFPFPHLLDFSDHLSRLRPHLSSGETRIIMEGYGIQGNTAKEKEILKLADLKTPLKELFLKKNIPPRTLFLLEGFEEKILKELTEMISEPCLKNNVAREIAENFSDLDTRRQREYLQKIKETRKNISKDGLSFLNTHYRDILRSFRFPVREAMKKEMDELVRSVSTKHTKVHYDDQFEESHIRLETHLHSEEEIDELPKKFQDVRFQNKLKQILKGAGIEK